MATYKKRGAKKTQNTKDSQATESRTEEVFSNLDTGASRLEHWIATYQRQIFGLIFGAFFSMPCMRFLSLSWVASCG